MDLDDELKKYLVFHYEDDVKDHLHTGKEYLRQLRVTTNEISSLSNKSFNLQLSTDSDRKFVYLVEEGTSKYFRVHLEYLVKSYVGDVEELTYEPE